MTLKLITQGTAKEQVIQLSQPRNVIGRQEGCALRIPSGEVSRRHCVLAFEDGNVTLEDLGSCNGTFLNDKRIKSKRMVHPGDTLKVGPITFTVEYSLADTNVQEAAASGKRPEMEVSKKTRDAMADTRTDPAQPALVDDEDDEVVEAVVLDDEVVDAKLADEEMSKPWDIPGDEDLRDILTKLEE